LNLIKLADQFDAEISRYSDASNSALSLGCCWRSRVSLDNCQELERAQSVPGSLLKEDQSLLRFPYTPVAASNTPKDRHLTGFPFPEWGFRSNIPFFHCNHRSLAALPRDLDRFGPTRPKDIFLGFMICPTRIFHFAEESVQIFQTRETTKEKVRSVDQKSQKNRII
jgi:hypothetical protein